MLLRGPFGPEPGFAGAWVQCLDLAITPSTPTPFPSLQTRDRGVFDTITPWLISTVDTTQRQRGHFTQDEKAHCLQFNTSTNYEKDPWVVGPQEPEQGLGLGACAYEYSNWNFQRFSLPASTGNVMLLTHASHVPVQARQLPQENVEQSLIRRGLDVCRNAKISIHKAVVCDEVC